jgi:endonuclease-3
MYRWNLTNGKMWYKQKRDAKRIFRRNMEFYTKIIWYGREYSPARGWDLKDIITKTVGRKTVLDGY